jgi:hypothetical protein
MEYWFDIRDVPLKWTNDLPVTQEQLLNVMLLRAAGCTCKLPLLGQRPIKGGLYVPRCRTCNIEVRLT